MFALSLNELNFDLCVIQICRRTETKLSFIKKMLMILQIVAYSLLSLLEEEIYFRESQVLNSTEQLMNSSVLLIDLVEGRFCR
jgi:hypothetical protein